MRTSEQINQDLRDNVQVSIKELCADEQWREFITNIFQADSFDWDGFYPVVHGDTGEIVNILPGDSIPEGAAWLDTQCRPTTNEFEHYAVDATSI